MGCAPPPKQQPLIHKESPVGLLRVTVLGLEHFTKEKYGTPEIRVRISNQIHTYTSLMPPNPESKKGENFTFAINSFYKPYGRSIEVGFFADGHLIAFGSLDANPMILHGVK
jgi:hypothetical protein